MKKIITFNKVKLIKILKDIYKTGNHGGIPCIIINYSYLNYIHTYVYTIYEYINIYTNSIDRNDILSLRYNHQVILHYYVN